MIFCPGKQHVIGQTLSKKRVQENRLSCFGHDSFYSNQSKFQLKWGPARVDPKGISTRQTPAPQAHQDTPPRYTKRRDWREIGEIGEIEVRPRK